MLHIENAHPEHPSNPARRSYPDTAVQQKNKKSCVCSLYRTDVLIWNADLGNCRQI